MTENTPQTTSPFPEQIMQRISTDKEKSLYIARIPLETKKRFTELAEKEFCNDFGMTLKWLIDGIPEQHLQVIHDRINAIEEQLMQLREQITQPQQEKKTTIKLLNGKIIERGGE